MAATTKPFSFQDRLREIDMFFQGNDPVHQTMNRVAHDLDSARIPYAVVGGMAVNAHRHRRTTDDVDFLLTRAGFAKFCRLYVPAKYTRLSPERLRFQDLANGNTFDILITGLYPGRGQPGPVAYPDPAQVYVVIDHVRVLTLPMLIQLKLAARRHYDYGDVVNLIRVHDLDETFASNLHSSLHQDFIECLEEKRRDDDYAKQSARRLQRLLKETKPKKYPKRGRGKGQ